MKNFYLYSASENSFYPVAAPEDSVVISSEIHTELFSNQENGMSIQPNKDGYPISVRQGKTYEYYHPNIEDWVIDPDLFSQYQREKEQELIEVKKSRLVEINDEIKMLERFTERSEQEEAKLQALITESQEIYRALNSFDNKEEGE